MWYRFMFVLLICCWASVVQAQRCGVEDTTAIGVFGTSELIIPIQGFVNGDLASAGQGVCGVSLYFTHSYVYGLTMTLFSPAGDSVQLVGPTTDQTRVPTALIRWYVAFQDCGAPPAPDGAAPARWNNADPFTWPSFGTYRGSYYPSGGCLADFDRGAVNGDWQLVIRNSRGGQQGELTFLQLEFCDDTHEEGPCCSADAGVFVDLPDIVRCQKPFDLPVAPTPRYGRPRPDAIEYDYSYVVVRNDTVLAVTDSPNLYDQPAGNYEICGLSYRRNGADLLPEPGADMTELRQDLGSLSPSFCGDLTPVCQSVLLVPTPDTTSIEPVICRSGYFEIGNQRLSTAGNHIITLPGYGGCDSTVSVSLSVVDTLRSVIDTTICAEGWFRLGARTMTTAGAYVDTLTSYFGCDSIANVQLFVSEPIDTSITLALCAGDGFVLGADTIAESGVYERVVPSALGCDSTISLDLVILDPDIHIAPIPAHLDCRNDSITLDARGSNLSYADDFGWFDGVGNLVARSLVVTVGEPGTYRFVLGVATRGRSCVNNEEVTIIDRRFRPTLDVRARPQVPCGGAGGPCNTITCSSPNLDLEAIVTPPRLTYTYSWTGPGPGTIDGPTDTTEVTISSGGRYGVTVVDTISTCTVTATIDIESDTVPVNVTFSGNRVLTCGVPELTLVADTSQLDAESLDFRWSGPCLPSGITAPTLSVDCPGTYQLRVLNRRTGCSRDTTFLVVSDRSPVILNIAPASAPLTCWDPVRTLEPASVQARHSVRYLWTNDTTGDTLGTERQLSTSSSGTFRLTVTDQTNECSATATVLVPADNLPPIADAGPELITLNCFDSTATLGEPTTSTGPGLRYEWIRLTGDQSSLGNNRQLEITAPGAVYEFTVFDTRNGCESVDTIRVETDFQRPLIRLAQALDFDCFVDSVMVDASATFLGFPHRQSWTGPCPGGPTYNSRMAVDCPGVYHYTLQNLSNGCSSSDSLEVGIVDNGVLAYVPDTVALDCESGGAVLDLSRSTPAPVTRWYYEDRLIRPRQTNPRVTLPGRYHLVLENFNGSCVDSISVDVVAPCPAFSAIIAFDSITCRRPAVVLDAGPSVPATATGADLEWLTPPGAIYVVGESERKLQVLSPGRYGFVIRNALSRSVDTSYVEVTLNQYQPDSEAGPRDTINCYNPTAVLEGSNSEQGPLLEYLWTNLRDDTIAFTQRTPITEPGTYLLRVTQTETGCSSIDNVTIFDGTTPPDIVFSNLVIPCDSTRHRIEALPLREVPHRYDWVGPSVLEGAATATPTLGSPGDYILTATRVDNGCSDSFMATVTQAPCPPFPSLPGAALTCRSGTVVLTPEYRDGCTDCTYRWRRNGILLPNTSAQLPVTEPGTYEVTAANTFGLTGTASTEVTDARYLPNGNAGPDVAISCDVSRPELGEPTTDARWPYSYSWQRLDGTVLGSAATIQVAQPGHYVLTTTNEFSACQASDTVRVYMDTISPLADAGPELILTCENKRRALDGLASSLGAHYQYRWESEIAPACISDNTTPNPIVRCGGFYNLTVRDTTNGCATSDSVFVLNDDALPAIIPLSDATLTCDQPTVTLTGGDTTGANLRYEWLEVIGGLAQPATAANSATLDVSSQGKFVFTLVNNRSGCTNEFDVKVREDFNPPQPEAGMVDTFQCGFTSLQLNGSVAGSGLSYEWRSATGFAIEEATSLHPVVFQPDKYYLTAANPGNGCRGVDSVLVVRDVDAPIVNAGSDEEISCARPQIQLNGSYSSVSGTGIVNWTSLDSQHVNFPALLQPVIQQAGRFQLNITDPRNGCRGADVVEVTADTLRPGLSIDTSQGTTLNCLIDTLELIVNFEHAGPSPALIWESTASLVSRTARLLVRDSSDYTARVTNQINGCTASLTQHVDADRSPPQSTIHPPASLTCSRDSVLLKVQEPGSYQYIWRSSQGDTLARTASFNVGAPGNYSLVTRDPHNGCTEPKTITVAQDTRQPPVRLAQPDPLDCARSETVLDATGSAQGNRYLPRWHYDAGTGTTTENPYQLIASEPGLYVFSVTDSVNGCQDSISLNLIRNAIPVDSFSIMSFNPVCIGEANGEMVIEEVYGGRGPYATRLNEGLITNRITYDNLPPGDYTIDVFTADGCTLRQAFSLETEPAPILELGPDTMILQGDSVRLDFNTNLPRWNHLEWFAARQALAPRGDSAIVVRPERSTTYRLRVTSAGGCEAQDYIFIEVDERLQITVPTAFSPNNDGRNDRLRPFWGRQINRVLEFEVYDRWGSLLYRLEDPYGDGADQNWGWDGTVNGQLLPSQVVVYRLVVELITGESRVLHGEATLAR